MKKKKEKLDAKYDFSPETVAKKRKFPVLNTVLLVFMVIVQVVCVLVMIFHQPKPQDVIDDYTIYVTPKDDGSLDIQYNFTWTPLDESEDLSWVEIGVANEEYSVLPERSDNIKKLKRYTDGEGYCSVRVYFTRAYKAGETVKFSFKINQKRILSRDGEQLLYEFVPGWFNYAQVKHYSFNFRKYGDIASYNGDHQDKEWLTWEGSLDYGNAIRMMVVYNSFDASTVKYERFDASGVYNGLKSDKSASVAGMVMISLLALVGEIFVIDAYISYMRGRGFMRGYGHSVHVYGYRNPHYTRAVSQHSSRGGSRGGGCACACACACAGGGRAGCSQKDTFKLKRR